VHVPGMLLVPETVATDSRWLWDVFQRTNFIKNVCLLGVCVHLLTHEPGRFSLPRYVRRFREGGRTE
jgi:uncharacterized membrane protein YphA (DoxX/SURF4 family)